MSACILLVLLLSIRPITELDVGYHLRSGEWMMENHSVPRLDPFTYTVPKNEYIDLHWLYQLALFLSWKAGGYDSLILLTAAVIVGVFLLTLLRMRGLGTPAWAMVPPLLAAVLASEIRFMVRPEVLSWLYLSVVLLLLERDASGRTSPLWLIPLLHLLWVNSQGLFVLGWIALGAHWVSALVHDRARVRRLSIILALSILACLMNPYGLKGFLFPATLFTRLSGESLFKHTIREFVSPWAPQGSASAPFAPSASRYVYRISSVLFFLLLAATYRRRKLHEFLASAAFFYLSAVGIRNIPLFMLAAAPVAAKCLGDLPRSFPRLQGSADFLGTSRASALAGTLLVLLTGARVVTDAWYISDRRGERFRMGLDRTLLPVGAAEFLREKAPHARLINHLNMGGWLDWRFPGKTFIDGRLEVIGEAFYRVYLSYFDKGGLLNLADRFGADFIVYNPFDVPTWTFQLKDEPAWRLVFLDEGAAVYARVRAAPHLPEATFEGFLEDKKVPRLPPPAESQAAWDLPVTGSIRRFLEGFVRRTPYATDLMQSAYFAFQMKRYEAAASLYAEANRLSRGRFFEIYFNAASLYADWGQTGMAKLCLGKSLEMKPGQPMALDLATRLDAPSPPMGRPR